MVCRRKIKNWATGSYVSYKKCKQKTGINSFWIKGKSNQINVQFNLLYENQEFWLFFAVNVLLWIWNLANKIKRLVTYRWEFRLEFCQSVWMLIKGRNKISEQQSQGNNNKMHNLYQYLFWFLKKIYLSRKIYE